MKAVEIEAPGGDLRDGLERRAFRDFGLYLFRSARLYLAVRCGPIGMKGRGAHAHNDQLAFELAIDGEDWVTDPGTYVYTAAPTWRNAYRSVNAHAAPRLDGREPGRLDLGPFWLGNEAKARCLAFDDGLFVGEHRGFGRVVKRTIRLAATTIAIVDEGVPDAAPARLIGRAAAAAHFAPSVPVSPGYGKRLRAR
jgi:hypothetical protein